MTNSAIYDLLLKKDFLGVYSMLALTISDEKKEQILRVASTMGEKQKR